MIPPNLVPRDAPRHRISSFAEALRETVLRIEQIFARKLGTLERLAKCERLPMFSAARSEWFAAWGISLKAKGVISLASEEPASEVGKIYVLEMLRKVDKPEVTLQKMAPFVYNAALDGDVKFFQGIALALKGHARAKRFGAPPNWITLFSSTGSLANSG
jgi:hypothetical protein